MRGRRELGSLSAGADARGPCNGTQGHGTPTHTAAPPRSLRPNLRYGSLRSAVTTPPQLHRRKLLKNGGRFPSSPRPASAHTNLLPCGAGGECSNRRRADQRSQSIGSGEPPLYAWVPPPFPAA